MLKLIGELVPTMVRAVEPASALVSPLAWMPR